MTADTTQPAGVLPDIQVYADEKLLCYTKDDMRAMMAERDAAREELAGAYELLHKTEDEKSALRRELEELQAQRPIAMVTRGGSVKFGRAMVLNHWCDGAQTLPDGEHALYARPIPPDAREGLLKLAKFGAAMLKAHRNDGYPGDIDGIEAQEAAEAVGVIVQRTVREPCREGCSCAEVGELPVDCYFVPDDVRETRDSILAGGPAGTSAEGETQP